MAIAVAEGKADAGLVIEAVARQKRIDSKGLFQERYDLVIWRRDYFEKPFQALLRFAACNAFLRRAEEMRGYDILVWEPSALMGLENCVSAIGGVNSGRRAACRAR